MSRVLNRTTSVKAVGDMRRPAEDQHFETIEEMGVLAILDTLDIDDFATSDYDDNLVLDQTEDGTSIASGSGYFTEEAYPEPLSRETSAFIGDDGELRMLLSALSEERPTSPSDIRSSNEVVPSLVPPSPVPPSPTGSSQTALTLCASDMSDIAPPSLFIPPPPPPPPLSCRVVTPTLGTKKKKKTKSAKKRAPRKKAPKTKLFVDKTKVDVLLGRGGCSNHHAGNATYRKKILELQPKYKLLSRQEKTKFSQSVVEWVQSRGGRFLKRDNRGGPWYVTTDHEARGKISQALREDHSPEGREAKKKRNKKAQDAKDKVY